MIDWSKTQFNKHSAGLMSLVGNFYSRITAKKIENLLRLSPIPTITELQEAIKDGEQVQGSEILIQLGGLQQKVQGHMQNLVVAGAIQEIVDVLTLVCLGRSPLHHYEADLWFFPFTGQQDLLRDATLAGSHQHLTPRPTSRHLRGDSSNLRHSPSTIHPC